MKKIIEFKSGVLPYGITDRRRGELCIKFGDIYNTGNIQFSIRVRTETKDCNDKWHEESWGMNGTFVLEHFKEIHQYLWLHGCCFDGAPMNPVGEGSYLLRHDMQRQAFKLLRIGSEEIDELKAAAYDKEYFSYKLHKMGIVKEWQDSAEGLIRWLEERTGETIERDFGTSKSDIHAIDRKMDEIEQLEAEGYYSDEKIMARYDEQQTGRLDAVRQNINDAYEEQLRKIELEREVLLSIVESGITSQNVIIYAHDNSVNFNWSYSYPLIPEGDIEKYVETIGCVRFPEMKFKNEHMGQVNELTRYQL